MGTEELGRLILLSNVFYWWIMCAIGIVLVWHIWFEGDDEE